MQINTYWSRPRRRIRVKQTCLKINKEETKMTELSHDNRGGTGMECTKRTNTNQRIRNLYKLHCYTAECWKLLVIGENDQHKD